MKRLLVFTPQEKHEVIDVGAGGGYFDASRVLWDEATQGQIPAEYLQLVADDSAKPTVPEVVPMLNARLALIAAGWMPGVQSILDSMGGVSGDQARAYFDHALTVRRDHPLVQSIPAALNKSDQEVNALFIAASTIA